YYLESENTTISTSKEEFKESGNEEKQRYVTAIKGSAVFKEDKLIGWIDGIETRSYMLIKNKAKNGIITADYNNGKESLSFTFRKSKSKMKAEFNEDNISFNIDIKISGSINALYTGQNMMKEEEINKMEQALSETVENNIAKLMSKAQKEFETDF